MMFEDEVKMVLKVPAALRREFKHYATDRDTSMSVLVREAITKMLQEEPASAAASPVGLAEGGYGVAASR